MQIKNHYDDSWFTLQKEFRIWYPSLRPCYRYRPTALEVETFFAVLQICDIWYGSADPCLWLMDPDPTADSDPIIFVIDFQDANKNFSALLFKGVFTVHPFSKKKCQKEVINWRNRGFSYSFCLMIEGVGSVPLTNGSVSGRPKNLRIRIRNTAFLIVCLCRT